MKTKKNETRKKLKKMKKKMKKMKREKNKTRTKINTFRYFDVNLFRFYIY